MKKADLLVPSVSAASIVAKVARDNYMRHLDDVFPGYKFTGHVGYGTAAHRAAIESLGVTPLHRLSFAPLQMYQDRVPGPVHSQNGFTDAPSELFTAAGVLSNEGALDRSPPSRRTTKQIGDTAENEVADFLRRRGHEILERNWRTKFCEIDIVSRRDDTLYFTEVKYRKSDKQGGGLAAITAKKQRQMAFAAKLYAAKENTGKVNLRLAAADVSGNPPVVREFLELG
jgi:ribonuclease HII